MLTPDYLAGIPAPMQDVYADLQTSIEADIARRIKKAGYTTDTAAWEVEKLKQMGASQAYIAQEVAKQAGMTQLEVRDLFSAAGIKSCATDEATRKAMLAAGRETPRIPLSASPAFRQVMEANLKRTYGSLQKLTGTMATDAAGKLNKYMDQAQMLVQSGAFTQEQAVDMTVKKFAADGVQAFDYVSGARTSVDAAVRRALITGVNQATAQVTIANAQALGTDLVEVTSHADARPEHAAWQGGIYSLNGYDKTHRKLSEATGYGTGAGLCGWNCRHSFYAYVEGISEPLPKQTYDSKTYYAEQKQRYNERMIRDWKRRANTLREGGSDPSKAEAKVREWQATQRQHVLDNDLARMYDREKVYGMGTLPPVPKTPKPVIPAPKIKTPEELAAEKREATLAASRERTRKWREGKKAAAETAKETEARLAAEAKAAADEAARIAAEEARAAAEAAAEAARAAEAKAAEEAWKKAEAEAAKKERLRAESRERTRLWRESKKASMPSKAELEAKAAKEEALREAEAKKVEEAFAREEAKAAKEAAAKEATAAKAAAEKAAKEPIVAKDPRVGEPGKYKVYRSTTKSVPPDGITAFHGEAAAAAPAGTLSTVDEYYVDIKKPLVIEGSSRPEARSKAFKALTGKDASTYHGDAGAEVARQLKAQGYDGIVYKLPKDQFELDPIDIKMAKETEATVAKREKAALDLAKATKAAEAKAAKDAADKAAKDAADAKAAAAEAKARAAARQAKGLKGVDNLKDGKVPPTLENFERTRERNIKRIFKGQDPLHDPQITKARDFTEKAVENCVCRSRIDSETMKLVMKDSKFKTQIELKYERDLGSNVRVTSGGMNDPEERMIASNKLFGTQYDDISPRDFEYYGYLYDDDFVADFEWDGPRSYGASTVQYKPEVRGRTTFTCGDSLGNSYAPSYVDDVTPCWDSWDTSRIAQAADTVKDPNVRELLNASRCGYVENQVHGGVTLDDIESFVYGPRDIARGGIDKKLVKALNERGIKVGAVEYLRGNTTKTKFRWLTEADWK